jgi:GNAT superfamily N-acetyltransferase
VDYLLDDDPRRIDFEAVWDFLSTSADWHRWRTRDQVERQVTSAWRVVGVYEESRGIQVGFARAVSDGVCDAYLADVYILESHRGHGLGKALIERMVEGGSGSDFRWTLFTGDAHGLYSQYGFGSPNHTAMVRPGRFAQSSTV